MTAIRRLLEAKGPDVWTVSQETSVYEAIQLMADKGVGALLVMDGQTLNGIVSERDYARKVILQGRSSRETAVADIMTANLITVTPEQTVDTAMSLMTAKKIRHLPVVEGDKVLGIVSIGDLVKSSLADKEQLIEQLENYITGH